MKARMACRAKKCAALVWYKYNCNLMSVRTHK